MTIVKLKAQHLIEIIEDGIIECGIETISDDHIKKVAIDREQDGYSWTCFFGGKIVGCYGIDPLWPGVGTLWAMLSPAIEHASIEICRKIKSEVERMSDGFHRVQCYIKSDFYASLRMMQFLEFKEECLCEKYSHDAQDYYLFSKVI